jgi:hypothetical protein
MVSSWQDAKEQNWSRHNQTDEPPPVIRFEFDLPPWAISAELMGHVLPQHTMGARLQENGPNAW